MIIYAFISRADRLFCCCFVCLFFNFCIVSIIIIFLFVFPFVYVNKSFIPMNVRLNVHFSMPERDIEKEKRGKEKQKY